MEDNYGAFPSLKKHARVLLLVKLPRIPTSTKTGEEIATNVYVICFLKMAKLVLEECTTLAQK
jgi:hypothetical protein